MIIHEVEQGTDEWFSLRAGMPTASEFSKLITSTGEPSKSMPTYAMALAAEMYAGKPLDGFDGNIWTDRGKELEDAARAAYAFITGSEGKAVGFVTNDSMEYGCSPDWLVEDGLAEFKCLKTENHVKAMLYYKKHGRCPTDYIQQTQGQMFITERAWCDLVFYHPVLPLVVIRQTPDMKVIDGLVLQLAAVKKERDSILETINTF